MLRQTRLPDRIYVVDNASTDGTAEMLETGGYLDNLRLPPWKKYYDVRNHLLIGRRYYGLRCWTQTLPGVIVRMVDSVVQGPDRGPMLRACVLGIVDGLLGRRDRRVLP
jgi:glycosyltransferase involved in cell wall biosynthesis